MFNIHIVLIYIIKFYQWTVSPILGGHCRFVPTCSYYAVYQLQNKPLWKAFFKIIWRILRCNPFCKGGYDLD